VREVRALAAKLGRARPPELEASGGITLENVRKAAETGVDRVSVGWITHSAPALDLALDLELSGELA
jgi:nicotinate-nucleotide pyrophosphorylase (carboxylating)